MNAAGNAAVGDKGDRFGLPLAGVAVDQRLEWGRIAVIVLGRDDDEGGCLCHGQFELVVLLGGRRFGLSARPRVDASHFEFRVLGQMRSSPVDNLVAKAPGPGAAVNQCSTNGNNHKWINCNSNLAETACKQAHCLIVAASLRPVARPALDSAESATH